MRLQMRLISAAMAVATVVGFLSSPAEVFAQFGDVDVFGNVVLSPDATLQNYAFYYDDLTTLADEGTIPESGNRIDPFLGTAQVEYEGRIDPLNPTQNINFDIVVGRTQSGQLLLNGAQLNDQNLILGDSGQVGPAFRRGTGVMRIEGFGALYNNDPTILPTPLLTSPSVIDRPTNVGYDMWVGRNGTGVLQLLLGGQAQIQDAVLVGANSNSIGDILIDGFDSFLQSGGFLVAGSPAATDVNYMIVGRYGSGTMTLQNGGQSYNVARAVASGNEERFGAVVGAAFAADNSDVPGIGGTGLVVVDGLLSKWTVGGSLQIGAFHRSQIGTGPLSEEDIEGELADYGNGVGHGTLRVTNGGLVSIIPPPINLNATNVPNRLDFLVGKFGTVELDGGRIELLNVVQNDNTSTNPPPRLDNGRLINDGLIKGDGTISVLQLRNRVQGEIRVDPGQSMIIASTGRYTLDNDNFPLAADDETYPLSNYGLVKVEGTPEARAEIEFQRNLVTNPLPADQTRPFLNLPLLPGPPFAPNGRTGGEILASNSVLRFDSNIINRHKVTFSGGSNVVTGNFVNGGDPLAPNAGSVVIGGIDTTVTFVDQFFNFGTLTLEPNVSLVTFIDDVDFDPDPVALGLAEVGPRILNMSFGNHIASSEDILLGGTLNASLFTTPGHPGSVPLAGAQYEIISSATDLVGDFDFVNLPDCVNGICFFGFADDVLDSYFIRSFDLNNPLVVGGDFDGSGLVDDLDFQIWRQNLGSTGAPGSLPGDANNDGIVDGNDFLIWLAQFGGPGMPGAGSGSFHGGSFAVPEPASVALLMAGGMLALAFARRRDG